MTAMQRVLDFVSPRVRSVFDVDTAFPSGVAEDGSVEGGLVLMRLRARGGSTRAGRLRLTLRFTEDGASRSSCHDIDIPARPGRDVAMEQLAMALRKGVMLQRYAETCRHFLTVAGRGDMPTRLLSLTSPERTKVDKDECASALRAVESLQADFAAAEAWVQSLCPGLSQQLADFIKTARAHMEKQPASRDLDEDDLVS